MVAIRPPYELPLLRTQVPVFQQSRVVDDVDAIRLANQRSENLTPNPGAEVDVSWWVPDTGTSITRNTGTVDSGVGAFLLTNTGGQVAYGMTTPYLPAKEGHVWRLSARIREGTGSSGDLVTTTARYYDENKNFISQSTKGTGVLTAAYTTFPLVETSAFWFPARNCAFMTLQIAVLTAGALNNTFFVDNVDIRRIGTLLSTNIEAPEGSPLTLFAWDDDINLRTLGGNIEIDASSSVTLTSGSNVVVTPGGSFVVNASGALADVNLTAGDDMNLNFTNLFFNGVESMFGAWTAFTPVITQSATITKTMVNSRYCRLGRLIVWSGRANLTSAGTAGNAVIMTLPVNVQGTGMAVGYFVYFDQSSTIRYSGLLLANAATNVILVWGEDQTGTNAFGADPAVTVANLDALDFFLIYEAAS